VVWVCWPDCLSVRGWQLSVVWVCRLVGRRWSVGFLVVEVSVGGLSVGEGSVGGLSVGEGSAVVGGLGLSVGLSVGEGSAVVGGLGRLVGRSAVVGR